MKKEISVKPFSTNTIEICIGNDNVYDFLWNILDNYNSYPSKDIFRFQLNGYENSNNKYYPYVVNIEISELFLNESFTILDFCTFLEKKYYLDTMCKNNQDCNDCCLKYICNF